VKAASYTVVTDASGQRGVIESSQLDNQPRTVVVMLNEGQSVVIPFSQLVLERNGYRFASRFDTLQTTTVNGETSTAYDADALVIPIITEDIVVSKDWVEKGRVRVTKRALTEEQPIHEMLREEHVHVERVPVNRPVDTAPDVRYEGDTMIVSLVEEVVVVEKRLVVKEELHITKRQTEREYTDTVTVRRDDVTVERFDGSTP
jgi:uncharacterized protein (TIGR02271 family)